MAPSSTGANLSSVCKAHIGIEDDVVFLIAGRTLSEIEKAAIAAEMSARRDDALLEKKDVSLIQRHSAILFACVIIFLDGVVSHGLTSTGCGNGPVGPKTHV